jgi:hypothetical protein
MRPAQQIHIQRIFLGLYELIKTYLDDLKNDTDQPDRSGAQTSCVICVDLIGLSLNFFGFFKLKNAAARSWQIPAYDLTDSTD